ncbi:MAG: polysaccharide deacetylase family protein [Eubacteriales bacterium]|nr:polysaccharide deacetylase family protein [Eubacteriales bacterium]
MKRMKQTVAAWVIVALLCQMCGALAVEDPTDPSYVAPEDIAVMAEGVIPAADDSEAAIAVEEPTDAEDDTASTAGSDIAESEVFAASEHVDHAKVQRDRSVPVLMYHAVEDTAWGIESLFVTEANFRAQMQYLKDSGYQTIHFSDLNHLEDYAKPIIITFDDGYEDNYTVAYQILKEYNMKATIFMVSSSIGKDRRLTADQLREMSDSGLISIQSHTADHAKLANLSAAQQEYQMKESQRVIASITGRTPYVLSYPEGSYNKTTLSLASKYYDVAVRSWGGRWTTGSNFYEVVRHPIDHDMTLSKFKDEVNEDVSVIFKDVKASAWYTPYVQRAYDLELMRGISGNTFGPNATLTRAQMAQILYNAAGSPEAQGSAMPFTDVTSGAWYYDAVQWAAAEGITAGTSAKTYSPNSNITREQFVTLLYRYAGKPAGTGSISKFPDAASASTWAKDAFVWATGIGMITGSKVGNALYLYPKKTATRAEAARMLTCLF